MRDNLFKLAGLCCGLGYGPTDWEGSSFPPVLNVLPEAERERERHREREILYMEKRRAVWMKAPD